MGIRRIAAWVAANARGYLIQHRLVFGPIFPWLKLIGVRGGGPVGGSGERSGPKPCLSPLVEVFGSCGKAGHTGKHCSLSNHASLIR